MSKIPAKKKPAKKAAPAKKPAKQKPEEFVPATAYESLSLDHQRFVDEYLIDQNATRAYMRCPGYAGAAYESARTLGAKLLTNVRIKAAVAERQAATRKRLELTSDNVLRQLARMAFVDLKGLYRGDGSLRAPHELDDDTAAAVQQIEVVEEFGKDDGGNRSLIGYTKKVRLVDRKGATELAMKHLGLLKERVEITGHESLLEMLR